MKDAVHAVQRVGDGALVTNVAVNESRALRYNLASSD
jgi:hypothetical protein